MNTPKELNARDTTPVSVRREYEKPEVVFETPLEMMAGICDQTYANGKADAGCGTPNS